LKEDTQLTLVKNLKQWLDTYFTQGSQTEVSHDGKFVDKKVIGVKSKNDKGEAEVVTNITPQDLFHRLEDHAKGKLDKSDNRDQFLKQVIIDWYNGKITPEGSLSKNLVVF
jgi:hypothetical protein